MRDGVILATCKHGIPDVSDVPAVVNSVNKISANIPVGLVFVQAGSKHTLIIPLL
jgi:hypothetical protein